MADKFRKDDVVNYVTSKGEQIHEWDGSVIIGRGDGLPTSTRDYRFTHPKFGEGMLPENLLSLVKRTRFEEGDRVVANETIGEGDSERKQGARGTVFTAADLDSPAPHGPQFLTICWDAGRSSGVYSSRVDYLEPEKTTIRVIPYIKNPDAPTTSELNSGSDVSALFKDAVWTVGNADDEFYGPTGGVFSTKDAADLVHAPNHYAEGVPGDFEVIDVIRVQGWEDNWYMASALKYILRAQFKGNYAQDLRKAVKMIEWELSRKGLEDA